MADSKLRDLSIDFSVKVIKMCDKIKGHYSLVNQLERSSFAFLPVPTHPLCWLGSSHKRPSVRIPATVKGFLNTSQPTTKILQKNFHFFD